MAARQGIDPETVAQMKAQMKLMEPWLMVGDTFDTHFEQRCTVLTAPNESGDFQATDADGVEARFHVDMVTRVKRPVADTCADFCPRCDRFLKREGYPTHHQHTATGEECAYTWAG